MTRTTFTWNDREYTATIDSFDLVDITSPTLHVQGTWASGTIHDARYRPRAHAPVPEDLLEAAERALASAGP